MRDGLERARDTAAEVSIPIPAVGLTPPAVHARAVSNPRVIPFRAAEAPASGSRATIARNNRTRPFFAPESEAG